MSRDPGVKIGGSVGSFGRERSGSSGMCQMILKSSGNDAATGWTFFAAFLYARARAGWEGSSCFSRILHAVNAMYCLRDFMQGGAGLLWMVNALK